MFNRFRLTQSHRTPDLCFQTLSQLGYTFPVGPSDDEIGFNTGKQILQDLIHDVFPDAFNSLRKQINSLHESGTYTHENAIYADVYKICYHTIFFPFDAYLSMILEQVEVKKIFSTQTITIPHPSLVIYLFHTLNEMQEKDGDLHHFISFLSLDLLKKYYLDITIKSGIVSLHYTEGVLRSYLGGSNQQTIEKAKMLINTTFSEKTSDHERLTEKLNELESETNPGYYIYLLDTLFDGITKVDDTVLKRCISKIIMARLRSNNIHDQFVGLYTYAYFQQHNCKLPEIAKEKSRLEQCKRHVQNYILQPPFKIYKTISLSNDAKLLPSHDNLQEEFGNAATVIINTLFTNDERNELFSRVKHYTERLSAFQETALLSAINKANHIAQLVENANRTYKLEIAYQDDESSRERARTNPHIQLFHAIIQLSLQETEYQSDPPHLTNEQIIQILKKHTSIIAPFINFVSDIMNPSYHDYDSIDTLLIRFRMFHELCISNNLLLSCKKKWPESPVCQINEEQAMLKLTRPAIGKTLIPKGEIKPPSFNPLNAYFTHISQIRKSLNTYVAPQLVFSILHDHFFDLRKID